MNKIWIRVDRLEMGPRQDHSRLDEMEAVLCSENQCSSKESDIWAPVLGLETQWPEKHVLCPRGCHCRPL